MHSKKKELPSLAAANLNNADEKRQYNRTLFKEVAPQYARITRLMSFGRDKAWKKRLIRMLPQIANPACLDIACGTGDISIALASAYPNASIRAIDLSEDMLAICKKRCSSLPGVQTVLEDMNAIKAKAKSFDIITGGYALRNSPDLLLTLKSIAKLLKPDGTAAFLDFSRSGSRVVQAIQLGLLSFWGKIWGLLLHRNPDVYGYIAKSLRSFPSRPELALLCRNAGLTITKRKVLFFGFIEIFLLSK